MPDITGDSCIEGGKTCRDDRCYNKQEAALDIAAVIVGFGISFGLLLLLYKVIPNTRTHWHYVWPGAMLAAAFFEIAKTVFIFYLTHIANYESIYGSIGSIIALVLWLYISAFILMLGAKFSSEYGRMKEYGSRKY